MKKFKLTNLDQLESESIYIIREVAAEFSNPVMMYSIGKDSSVMLHLARKAFYPSKIPFPLLHVDTKWKFNEMYQFRDNLMKDKNIELLTYYNLEGTKLKINPFLYGNKHTDIMKTEGLKQALNKWKFNAIFGGARRDEEKSRSKERIYSFRNRVHHWDPKNQRPEIWKNYNSNINQGESIRVFPLSNWTEIDIWQYIFFEKIEVVPLYFAKKRPVIERNGMIIVVNDDRIIIDKKEKIKNKLVRFRTLGCWPLTGAILSKAKNLLSIIAEMLLFKNSEREGRLIDKDQDVSMEIKKRNGYF